MNEEFGRKKFTHVKVVISLLQQKHTIIVWTKQTIVVWTNNYYRLGRKEKKTFWSGEAQAQSSNIALWLGRSAPAAEDKKKENDLPLKAKVNTYERLIELTSSQSKKHTLISVDGTACLQNLICCFGPMVASKSGISSLLLQWCLKEFSLAALPVSHWIVPSTVYLHYFTATLPAKLWLPSLQAQE